MRKISSAAILFAAAAAVAFAAGNVKRGKELFNDPALSGSTNDRSCNTCHPGGKGLEAVAGKKEYQNPAGSFDALKRVINQCIANALNGKPLPENSVQMEDLVAYIRSLK